jgi:hypothetical protein
MNMFKPTKATNREEYFAMLAEERRSTLVFLDSLIQKTVPDMKPWFTYNMLGYGKFDYVNYKKEEIKWPVIAMASQKNYMSLYVCALDGDEYIAEKFAKELYADGVKPNVGKSCIRFKNLDELNLDILKKVLKEAQKQPGLVAEKK